MKLNAELVVLSACSTGQGKITGDGVVGLSRCLIAAGVKSIIVSLWSVGDLSTALLMVKFYKIFQQGVAATIALNEAQRWLLGITSEQLSAWVKANDKFLDATLRIDLRRRLFELDTVLRFLLDSLVNESQKKTQKRRKPGGSNKSGGRRKGKANPTEAQVPLEREEAVVTNLGAVTVVP